jgi:hypothetical protein
VLGGVAEPLGKFIAMKLGVSYEPVMYPNPEAYVQSFGKGEWDIAIGPRVLAPPDKAARHCWRGRSGAAIPRTVPGT